MIMRNDLDVYRELEKLLGITIAYYNGTDIFNIISGDFKNIPLEHLSYQRYPKTAGYYRLIKANCDNSECDIGKPPVDCKVYCKQKCAVWEYDLIKDSYFMIGGDKLVKLLGEIEDNF